MAFDIDPHEVANEIVADMDKWVRWFGKSYKEAFRHHLPTLPYGCDAEVKAIVGSIIGSRPHKNSRKDYRRANRTGMELTPVQAEILGALPRIRHSEAIRNYLGSRDYRHTIPLDD